MKIPQPTKSIFSRRKFLSTLGITAGASVITPLLPSFISKTKKNNHPGMYGNSFHPGETFKIGVLLPPSNIYPMMSDNFIAGMILYLDQIGNQVGNHEIVLLEKAIGFSPGSAAKKAYSLIESEDINLVTGIMDMAVNKELRQLFHDQKRILIANQVGANLIRPEEYSSYILHNSLDMWQANWAMGNWAAQNIGKKAIIAASFYESGYDALYAFNLGFENAGGRIEQTIVNNLPTDDKDLEPLTQTIKKSRADLVFAAYSGDEAIEFIKAYHLSGLGRDKPLIGSGFLVDDTQIPMLGSAALGIKSCFPWSSTLNHIENQDFTTNFKNKYKRLPDSFAVLGFETAQIITNAMEKVEGDFKDTAMLSSQLSMNANLSPRGQIRVNTTNQTMTSPLYMREVIKQGTKTRNEVFERVEPFDNPEHFSLLHGSGTKTGWLNPYLCA